MIDDCPICGEKAIATCRCPLRDSRCAQGHQWHLCILHDRIVVGPSDHQAGSQVCQCPEGGTEGEDHERLSRDLQGLSAGSDHRENGVCQNCLRIAKITRTKATKARHRKGADVTVAEAFRLLNEGKAYVRH